MAFDIKGLQGAVNRAREKQKYARLKDFVVAAWPIVEGNNEFRDNWHIDAICEHLEAVTNGTIKKPSDQYPPWVYEVAHHLGILACLGMDQRSVCSNFVRCV